MKMRCKKCNGVPPKDFEALVKKAGLTLDDIDEWWHSNCYPEHEPNSTVVKKIKSGVKK